MEGHDDSRIGSVLDGRYRLVAKIATGGMGMVYRGERVGIGKKVAIKFLHRSAARDPAHRTRFDREAEAMSRVSHPNLVSVIDHGVVDGIPYLVMEFFAGESLRVLLKRGPVPPGRAVGIARHVIAGVHGLHAAGVIHRDLKPENVLLLDDLEHDFAKVLDFGIAKIFDGDSAIDVTRAGHVVGTPSYMSPEQARGAYVDQRADIYSIGVLLYEMVTGRRPFEGDEDLAILRKHVEVRPRSPREVGAGAGISEALEAVILKALAKSPDDRYATATEMGIALGATPEHARGTRVTRPVPVEREPSQPRTRPPVEIYATHEPPRARSRGGIGLFGVLVAAAIGVGIGWVARDPSVLDKLPIGRGGAAVDAGVPDTAPADAASPAVDAGTARDAEVPVAVDDALEADAAVEGADAEASSDAVAPDDASAPDAGP